MIIAFFVESVLDWKLQFKRIQQEILCFYLSRLYKSYNIARGKMTHKLRYLVVESCIAAPTPADNFSVCKKKQKKKKNIN